MTKTSTLLVRPAENLEVLRHLDRRCMEDASRIAREVRRLIATSGEFVSDFSAARVELPDYLRKAACSMSLDVEPSRALAFTLAITNAGIDHVLVPCASDSERFLRVGIAQHIVEQELLELYDPSGTGRMLKHEGVAKELGAFFTPTGIALWMAREALSRVTVAKGQGTLRLLDPAVGVGVFPCAVLYLFITERALFPKSITRLQIRGTDINERYSTLAKRFAEYLAPAAPVDLQLITADGLGDSSTDFDVILMNPPYGRLKILKATHTQRNTKTRFVGAELDKVYDDDRVAMASVVAKLRKDPVFAPLVTGTLEKSRLFLIHALSRLKSNGALSIIGPDTWLSDQGSLQLRRALRNHYCLHKIVPFKETARLFPTVNQTTAITVLTKAPQRADANIEIYRPAKSLPTSDTQPLITTWLRIDDLDSANISIAGTSSDELTVVSKLRQHPALSTLDWVINRRGECDLTLYKDSLSEKDTGVRLVRGDHLERFELRQPATSQKSSYIRFAHFKKCLGASPKLGHIELHRIAGRQVSYVEKARRFSFASVPPGVVLANSCNYLIATTNNQNAQMFPPWRHYYLLGVINSYVLEWLFRKTSRTNHVNNSDLDNLPIPMPTSMLARSVAASAAKVEGHYRQGTSHAPEAAYLEALVARLFALSRTEFEGLLESFKGVDTQAILEAYDGLGKNVVAPQVLDSHEASPMSELDHKVMGYIPEGGNWSSVPASVPSKRLEQIREMTRVRGGMVRTSYYGRLLQGQPSYTISTYFTRPGNGTHILPDQDRTLSTREAARLQSFPDDFGFIGSQRAKHEQVGNAVPPLLAYAVAESLRRALGKKRPNHVDFFAGAGGLSLGFHWAGFKLISAQELGMDHSRTFAKYFKVQHAPFSHELRQPTQPFIMQGDVTVPELRKMFFAASKKLAGKSGIDVVVGGPPCQGFSLAGYHKASDRRNDLAALYVDCIAKLRPRYFVLENVEGLRFMKGGQVLRDLMAAFREAGYVLPAMPWVLKAEQFGAPQMRRRVILVGHLPGEAPVELAEPGFEACRGRRERGDKVPQPELALTSLRRPTTVRDAISDLPRLDAGESCEHNICAREVSPYARFMRGELTSAEFLSGKIS